MTAGHRFDPESESLLFTVIHGSVRSGESVDESSESVEIFRY